MNKNSINTLPIKIITIVISISYFIFFIHQYITKDFNLNNAENIIKLILLFVIIFICSLTAISNSKATYVFSILNILLIVGLLLYPIINKTIENNKNKKHDNKTEEKKENIEDENNNTKEDNTTKITCTGANEISENAKVEIDYIDDKIKKVVYFYTFDMEEKDGVENLVNKFDKQYVDFDTIYSEITISDRVDLVLTYDVTNIESDKLDKKFTSFKELEEKELNKMECKSREN